MPHEISTRSPANARKPLRPRKSASIPSGAADRAVSEAQVSALTARQKRTLIDQIVTLDALLGEDDPSSGGLDGRLTNIDERRHILLIKSIPRVRRSVVRSRSEAVRVLAAMQSAPLSLVQVWEGRRVVFSAEFTPKYVRVHGRLAGEWEAALDRLVASSALH
jgi:hypothetical protein